MQGSDNSAEKRARMVPTVNRNERDQLVHDFRGRLSDLCFSVQLDDAKLMEFYLAELVKLYGDALGSRKMQ